MTDATIGVESNITLIAGLLDESGSMLGVKAETIGGYNSFVDSIRKEQEGKEAYISTFLFDSNGSKPLMRVLQNGERLSIAAPLTDDQYNPTGMTPLYDAIGLAIKALDEVVAEKKVTKVTFMIQTDGAENASREFKLSDIRKLIESRNASGWQIIFLGADLDNAKEVGGSLGVMTSNSMRYDKSKTADTFNAASASTQAYRSAGVGGQSVAMNLSKEEKAALGDNS